MRMLIHSVTSSVLDACAVFVHVTLHVLIHSVTSSVLDACALFVHVTLHVLIHSVTSSVLDACALFVHDMHVPRGGGGGGVGVRQALSFYAETGECVVSRHGELASWGQL